MCCLILCGRHISYSEIRKKIATALLKTQPTEIIISTICRG